MQASRLERPPSWLRDGRKGPFCLDSGASGTLTQPAVQERSLQAFILDSQNWPALAGLFARQTGIAAAPGCNHPGLLQSLWA